MTYQFATALPLSAPAAARIGVGAGPVIGPMVGTLAAPAACGCGHSAAAHQHHRLGTDCGFCGARHCPSFRPALRPATGA